MIGERTHTILGRTGPPFDIDKPNIHNSKAEFLAELDTVREARSHVGKAFDLLIFQKKDVEPTRKLMLSRLAEALDEGARRRFAKMKPESIDELVRKNAAETGLHLHAMWTLLDLINELDDRLKELRDQKRDFWSSPNRPPNHYARTIALRLARLYARETQKKPTFGLARDGGHPSTDFGRGLEEVFALLGIKARVRRPAEWAIAQLTDDDTKPQVNMLGGLFGLPFPGHPGVGVNALAGIVPTLEGK